MSRRTVYNTNLTRDWENVSAQNRRLVRDFLQYAKANDKSPQTIAQYEEWLKVFFCWNLTENEDRFFVELKRRDFVHYFAWCRDRGMSANRVASLQPVLSSLSSEIELLYEDLYPSFHNQLRGLEPVHIAPVRQKTVISDEKMAEMLQQLSERGEHQLACYLALACASGSRKAELLQMQADWFTPDREVFGGYMYVTPEIRTKGRGVQGKIIKKYVIKELFDPFLQRWLQQREELGITCPELFVAKVGQTYRPAIVSTANSFAARISKIFNIEYYTHSSRHFFCTYLKRMKLPDDVIVQIFGWADTAMLKIYNDIPAEEALSEFFLNFMKQKEDANDG